MKKTAKQISDQVLEKIGVSPELARKALESAAMRAGDEGKHLSFIFDRLPQLRSSRTLAKAVSGMQSADPKSVADKLLWKLRLLASPPSGSCHPHC